MYTASAIVANRKIAVKRETIRYRNNKEEIDARREPLKEAYKERDKENKRKYHAEHREYRKKYLRHYHAENREQLLEKQRQKRVDNVDAYREKDRQRYYRDKDKRLTLMKNIYQNKREEKIAKQLARDRAKKEAGYRYRIDPVTRKHRWIYVGA